MKRLVLCLFASAVVAAPGAFSGPAPAAADPHLPKQWGLTRIGAPEAWAVSRGAGVTVAVVDTGIDLDHEEFQGRISAHVSCLGADDDARACSGAGGDDVGHGTHVAGIAAASTGNGTGVASVAPDATLMVVRVLEASGQGGASGTASDVRAGIRWAVDHGADVINLSLGGDIAILNLLGSPLADALNDAWAAGVVPVVAAGNDALFPTGYRGVKALVVTATDVDDRQASYASSVSGADWGIAAPGGDGPTDAGRILSTWWDPDRSDGYRFAAGTSMAAPHVSGAVASLLALGLSPQQAVDRLLGTAHDLGAPGPDSRYGHGRLDLAAAVAGHGAPGVVPPTAPPAVGASGAAAGVPGPDVAAATRPVAPVSPARSQPPATPGAPAPALAPADAIVEPPGDPAVGGVGVTRVDDERGRSGGWWFAGLIVTGLAAWAGVRWWRRAAALRT